MKYPNPIMLTDCYNLSHTLLKKNTDYEISHIYNRSRPMILYGLNKIVTDLLNTKIEVDMVIEAEENAKKMNMPFPSDMWYDLAYKLDGWIPLKFEAMLDGTWIPKGTPFAQITNTEQGYGELVTWWEAMFIHAYFSSGCATEALMILKYLKEKQLETNRVHSFGFRGHQSLESATKAGTAWNLFLSGTDDFHTIQYTDGVTSIPATAHKTIQQFDEEYEAYTYSMLEIKKAGFKIVTIVIDTYNPDRFINQYALKLARYAKQLGIKIVFRPDSGDTIDQVHTLYNLMKENDLLQYTSVILGESISLKRMIELDTELKRLGVLLIWVAYGIGSGFYKHIERDYLGWAMKTAFSNGKARMKLSTPFKQSIPDQIILVENNGLEVKYGVKGNLMQEIYHYDERSSRPKILKQDWKDIQKIANAQDTSQQEIIINQEIKDKIDLFRKKYA